MRAKQKVADALAQYEDGAITYVEFVRFARSRVTEQDVADHNQYVEDPGDVGRIAKWPFEG